MQRLSGLAEDLYGSIKNLPIVSPHGQCDPAWFAQDEAFSNPSDVLVVSDPSVLRMLYSQGVPLEDLGLGAQADPRAVFGIFAAHWHLFLGTPTRLRIDYVLRVTLGITQPLNRESANQIYDEIADRLARADHKPRAMFDRFGIELLATRGSALDDLQGHSTLAQSGWPGRVVPTFCPDGVLNPMEPGFLDNLDRLARLTDRDLTSFSQYLDALRQRRAHFRTLGATATDHVIETVWTEWLDTPQALWDQVRNGSASPRDKLRFYGHMLIEMAQMSVDDGLVMQVHAGCRRNTNASVMTRFGHNKGADMPVATDWVRGLNALLNRVGNIKALKLILFTMDEAGYARELAPMAGHWPCLRIGGPWWFHDSPAGIARYFDRVVETAGYYNLAGFTEGPSTLLSIPARHDMWRRGVSLHLSDQVGKGSFGIAEAAQLSQLLAVEQARDIYDAEA